MKITKKDNPLIVKIAQHCFPEYKGRKFELEYKTEIDTEYNISGSRTFYKFIRLDNGKIFDVPDFAPWKRPNWSSHKEIVDIPQGAACVTHTYFCGHDMGIRVYLPVNNQLLSV